MALGKYDSRAATVSCPRSGCDIRIFRDRASYAAHMVNVHNAADTVFLDEGIRGTNHYDRGRPVGVGGVPVVFCEEEVLLWCGCGSTFLSHILLNNHLEETHETPPPV